MVEIYLLNYVQALFSKGILFPLSFFLISELVTTGMVAHDQSAVVIPSATRNKKLQEHRFLAWMKSLNISEPMNHAGTLHWYSSPIGSDHSGFIVKSNGTW